METEHLCRGCGKHFSSDKRTDQKEPRCPECYAKWSDEKLEDSFDSWSEFWGDSNKVKYEVKKVELLSKLFGISRDAATTLVFLISLNTWAAATTRAYEGMLEHAKKHERLLKKMEDDMDKGDEWKPDED